MAVYETPGSPVSTSKGAVDTGTITRRLVWNARDDWKVTTIAGPTVTITSDLTRSEVGSYDSQNGRTYTRYQSWNDVTKTQTLDANVYIIAGGMFSDIAVALSGVSKRTDNRVVLLDMEYCDGATCDAVRTTRSVGGETYTQGQQFGDYSIIFTNDEYLIPVRAGDAEVLELHTNPPTPTPTATPIPTPESLNGNPRAESVTGTSVTISWDRIRRVDGELVRDVRVNYRQSATQPWRFGSYVESLTFSDLRPVAIVDGLQCNTQYEFQVEYQLNSGWYDYGAFTASTGAC